MKDARKREPQNTACDEPFGRESFDPELTPEGLRAERLSRVEQGIMNVEGKENFIIRNSLFDIRYSK
jgi:hypothetical protein